MNKAVYEKLKETARNEGYIPYSQLVSECNLDLDLTKIKDRNELAKILGEISTFEVEHGRAMLSVVVVLKDQHPLTPSTGFYRYADMLNVRKKGETNTALCARQFRECFDYWKTH